MATSPPDSNQRPVRQQDLDRHLDEMFEGNDSDRHQRWQHTLQQAAKHGLDYSQGNPILRSLRHLAELIDQRLNQWREKEWLPRSLREEDLEAWGKKVEAWGERVNQQQSRKRKPRRKGSKR